MPTSYHRSDDFAGFIRIYLGLSGLVGQTVALKITVAPGRGKCLRPFLYHFLIVAPFNSYYKHFLLKHGFRQRQNPTALTTLQPVPVAGFTSQPLPSLPPSHPLSLVACPVSCPFVILSLVHKILPGLQYPGLSD